jgi:hypothetical protein
MELSYEPKPTRPVTRDELVRFVAAADKAGEGSLGTAAMIAYYWLQREEDIIGRLNWNHYRPVDAPDVARIFQMRGRVNRLERSVPLMFSCAPCVPVPTPYALP